MTEKDTLTIMAMLSAYYGEGKSNARLMATAWHAILKDYNVSIAQQAVIRFAREDTRDYATFPPPGKIVAAIEAEEKLRYGVFNALRARKNYDTLDDRYKSLISKERYEAAAMLPDEELDAGKDMFIQSLMPREVLKLEG